MEPLTNQQVKKIKIGRMVGLFFAFGFVRGMSVAVDDVSLVRLDTLLAVE